MQKRKFKQYTEDFKRSSAKLAIESDQPITATARNLGVHEVTLHGWVKRYGPNTKTDAGSSSKIDAHAEIQRLKKENARLQMERDILKKAAAYFAGDQL
ncbi:MAG: transposase [Gammaproteobacteria bacterium]